MCVCVFWGGGYTCKGMVTGWDARHVLKDVYLNISAWSFGMRHPYAGSHALHLHKSCWTSSA